MSPHRTDHAPETLDPEGDTPPAHPRRRSSERNLAIGGASPFERHHAAPETPEEGTPVRRRTPALSESTVLKVSLGLVGLIGGVMLTMTWRVSTQVQQIQDRLRVEEKTLRIVAKKVGVEAIDLAPDERDESDH